MINLLIRCCILVVTLGVISLVMSRMNQRKNAVTGEGDDTHYVVQRPDTLKQVGWAMTGFGILAFCVFGFIRLRGETGITIGLFVFALVFAGIGLLYVLVGNGWRIEIADGQMEIHRMFCTSRTFSVEEVDHAEVTKRNQLVLFCKGEKIASVNYLCDNYDRLKKTLEDAGKLRG